MFVDKSLSVRESDEVAVFPTPSSPAEFLQNIETVEEKYSSKTSYAVTIIKNFGSYVEAVDWLSSNSSIISRVSQSIESAIEGVVSSFIFLVPVVQFSVIYKQNEFNNGLASELENLQTTHPEIYLRKEKGLVSDSERNILINVRKKIQTIQLSILQKNEDLKAKTKKVLIKAIYFTYSIVASVNALDRKIVKSFFKLFVVAIKECSNSIAAIKNICKQHETVYSLSAPVIDNSEDGVVNLDLAKRFLLRLHNCSDMESVKKECNEAGIDLFLPDNIAQFRYLMCSRRYQDILFEKFEYSLQENTVFSKISQFGLEGRSTGTRRIDTNKILSVLASQQQDYEARLKLLEDDIGRENPTITDPEKIKEMARSKLGVIDGEARILKMAVAQTLMAKHKIERPFYYYSIIASIQKLSLFSAKFVGSCLTKYGRTALYDAVDTISSDLFDSTCISGIVTFFSFVPLISQINFKMVNVIIDISQVAFARQYKPNEYSVEGYYHSFLLEKLKLQKFVYQVYLTSMKARIYIKAFVERSNVKENLAAIVQDQKAYNKSLKKDAKLSKSAINNLKVMDLNHAVSTGKFNTIQIISERLAKANIKYYPADTLEFFSRHFHLEIDRSTSREPLVKIDPKKLSEQVSDLFMADSQAFLESIQNSEISYYTRE